MEWSFDPKKITYFAATHTRGQHTAFGIRAIDRTKHMYVIGKTGMGKSTMLENLAIQDIQNGEGLCFLDPHGSTAEKLLDFIPEERVKDVLYLAPFDLEYPIGFNLLEDVGYDQRHLVVSGLMGVFERLWADAWSARMSYILQNTLFALMEYPGATLLDVNLVLTNKAFREAVVNNITDPVVKQFWEGEFASYSDRYTQEATPAIQNKIGQLTNNPLIRNILGQPESTFDVRKMMDERKILIMNLSKGRIGESNTALLGAMFVVKIYLSALTRAAEPAARMKSLPPFYFYVDEFQSVMNRAFENILSEARKYGLALTLANQYVAQMEEEVRNAVFGNVGTFISFRIGPEDAEFVKTMFDPYFTEEDMQSLGIGEIYLRLMIDGVGSEPFSAKALMPIDDPEISFREEIIDSSRRQYSRPRAGIEKKIIDNVNYWLEEEKQAHKKRSAGGQKNGPGGVKLTQKPGGPGGGKPQGGNGPQGGKPQPSEPKPAPTPSHEKQKSPFDQMKEQGKMPEQKQDETPKPIPAKPPKPEVKAEKEPEETPQQKSEPQKKSKQQEKEEREKKEKNALRDAIMSATVAQEKAKQEKKEEPKPIPAKPPKQKKEEPKEAQATPPQANPQSVNPYMAQKGGSDEVSNEVLERLINGHES